MHAQNSSHTLFAIKYHKTNKHCPFAHHSISHRLHKPHALLVEGNVSLFIADALQCVSIIQHYKCCAMFSPHQFHISAVQQFPHIPLAHALIQSQCSYCAHPCNKDILQVKFGLWTPHFVHNSISDAFHAMKENSLSL